MSEDRGTSLAGGAPASDSADIRNALAAAFAEDAKRNDEPAPAPANGADSAPGADRQAGQAAASDPRPDSGEPAGEPPRPPGEPKPGDGEPIPAEPPEPRPGEGEPAPAAVGDPTEAPRHWSAADRDTYGKLPADAKAPFMQLYRRMERGFTDRLERGAQLDRDYGVLDQTVFTPQIRAQMAQGNYTIRSLVESWARAEMTLNGAQQNKDSFLADLICHYGGNTNEIARYIHQINDRKARAGAGGAAPAPPASGAPPALDPTQLSPDLVNYLTAIANDVGALKSNEQLRVQNEGMSVLAAFAEERDAQGNLLHPDFEQLQPLILKLATEERAAGRAPDIRKIYNEALWQDPSTRGQQLQRERDAAAQRAAGEANLRAERARRAGSSVSGAPGGPGTSTIPPDELSIRDSIVKGLNADRRSAGGGRRI